VPRGPAARLVDAALCAFIHRTARPPLTHAHALCTPLLRAQAEQRRCFLSRQRAS
jgi:hypothetical protein